MCRTIMVLRKVLQLLYLAKFYIIVAIYVSYKSSPAKVLLIDTNCIRRKKHKYQYLVNIVPPTMSNYRKQKSPIQEEEVEVK